MKAPQVKEVVQTLQNSPTAAFLRDLSFHERLMLASLIKCVKREGVEEIKLSEVGHYPYFFFLYPNTHTNQVFRIIPGTPSTPHVYERVDV